MTPEEFYQQLLNHNIELNQQQKRQFEIYFNLLIEWNKRINLTAITNKREVYLKHFFDSLAPILYGFLPNKNLDLLDIGAGAGFPSIPIKIIYPNLKMTIIDSLNKRIQFLKFLSDQLRLKQVNLYHGRSEECAQENIFRAQFDIVTARAVARMPILFELTIPYLKIGGRLIAFKARAAQDELEHSDHALTLLFSKMVNNITYKLPNGNLRTIIIIEKRKETPKKYPRKAGVPAKRPL